MAEAMGNPGMASMLGKARQRAQVTLNGFSSGQKVMTGLAVLVVVVGGYLFSSWAGKATYAPLFSNLSSTDAASITQKLSSAKVSYKLADGGATVLVPQSAVYQERLNMSSAGLPANGNQGYALLDKQGITTSEFQQQVDYQRAVEGELAKTINVISGVSGSVVHVVLPQNDIFASTTNKPSASVLVQMIPGRTLSPTQVQAVVHLVASSIENLDPSNVTVADDKGDVLSAPGTDGASAASGDANSQQTQLFDTNLGTSLQNMLATVLGPGKAVVHVSADLNFDDTQTSTKTYDPTKQGPVAVSDATASETYNGPASGSPAGGTLGQTTATGTQSAVSGTPTSTSSTSGTPSAYQKSDASHNFAVGEVDQTVKSAPGSVKRMSVAVLVDSSVKGVDAPTIQRLVSAAAGLDTTRGDTIQVGQLPFDQTSTKTAAKALQSAASAKQTAGLLSTVKTVLILLVVALLVIFALRKLSKTTRIPIEPLPYDLSDFELARVTSGALAPAARGALAPPTPEPTRALAAVGSGQAANAGNFPPQVADLGQMIDRDPVEIAELLRSWLSEEQI